MTRRELLAGGAVCAFSLWGRSHWDRTRIGAITDELGNTSDEAVDLAHEFKLLSVELRNVPGTNKEYPTIRDAEIKADATHLMNEGVKVSCVDTSLLKFAWPGSEAADQARWDRRMDDLRKALACAQLMGADKVRVFAGLRAGDVDAVLPRTADTLGEMAVEAEKQRINLLLENDAATNVATCAELAAVMKLLPSKWVGLSWNPQAGSRLEESYPGGYALLPKKRILNVRVPRPSLMPGTEAEDWRALLPALDKDGYGGKIILETGVTGTNRIASARDSMEQLEHIVREVS